MCSAAFISSGVSSSSAVVAFAARLPSNCCRFSQRIRIGLCQFLLQYLLLCRRIGLHLAKPRQQAGSPESLPVPGAEPFRPSMPAPAQLPRRLQRSSETHLPFPVPGRALGTLPSGPSELRPGETCPPPACAPSAAAINCNNFCGSFKPLPGTPVLGLRRDLRRDAHISRQRISRHELHFIDSGIVLPRFVRSQSCLDLL